MGTTAIVFVGHSKERLIESIRSVQSFSINKIILVIGEQQSTGERKARGIAEELKKDLRVFFDVGIRQIDKKDVMRAAQQITDIIRTDQEGGSDVILNMSGSLRTFSIAAYIAGCITRSKMITAIPEYDEDDEEVGIEDIVALPPLPLNVIKPEQRRILDAIGEGVTSLDDLVIRLTPDIRKNSDAFPKERSRLSHHLKNFEEMGLIEKEKKGKNVGVKLTKLGELLRL
ncbi:MAG: DUF6293 family protein [Methanoregula sp.]|nr:MAG: DUF6293 family protein [Methanoregula sp.]